MRSLLTVAVVMRALDSTLVALDAFERPRGPVIEAGMLGQDPGRNEPRPTPAPVVRDRLAGLASRAAQPSDSGEHTQAATPTAVPGGTPEADAADPTPTREEPPPAQIPTATPLVPTPDETATAAEPIPSPTPTGVEPTHGHVVTEDDGRLTVEIVLAKTRFLPRETVVFTLRMCNRTDEVITWGYPDSMERPVVFGFLRRGEEGPWANLRNGDQLDPWTGPEAYVDIPPHDCVAWDGRWEQTQGEFELDGDQPFPSGELTASLYVHGGAVEREFRHPEYRVALFIG